MLKYENGYAYIDGYKFKKDVKSGYYLSSKKIDGKRKRLHVYIWEKHNNCSVPKGYEIHHKDRNKDNNDISNFMCMTRKAHLEWHNDHDYDELVTNAHKGLEIAREKAKEWHKSEEGRAFHRKLAKQTAENPVYGEFECKQCGKTYTAKTNGKHSFCSPTCRTKYRIVNGLDDEVRTCVICESNFTINKYRKNKTCSKACATKLTMINRSK